MVRGVAYNVLRRPSAAVVHSHGARVHEAALSRSLSAKLEQPLAVTRENDHVVVNERQNTLEHRVDRDATDLSKASLSVERSDRAQRCSLCRVGIDAPLHRATHEVAVVRWIIHSARSLTATIISSAQSNIGSTTVACQQADAVILVSDSDSLVGRVVRESQRASEPASQTPNECAISRELGHAPFIRDQEVAILRIDGDREWMVDTAV